MTKLRRVSGTTRCVNVIFPARAVCSVDATSVVGVLVTVRKSIGGLTVRVTDTARELVVATVEVTEIVPVYVPGARFPGDTLTSRCTGDAPADPETG